LQAARLSVTGKITNLKTTKRAGNRLQAAARKERRGQKFTLSKHTAYIHSAIQSKEAHTGVIRAHKRNKHTGTEQLTSSLSDSQKIASLDSRGRARIEQFPLDKST
jgi:hypothetical protein